LDRISGIDRNLDHKGERMGSATWFDHILHATNHAFCRSV